MFFKKKQQTVRRQFNTKEMFFKMEASGVNTRKELLWGYFFVDKIPETLEKIKNDLQQEGLKFVGISKHDDNKYWLHVEEICVHTHWTMNEKCEHFNDLAERFNIERFDGWDVGNSDKTRPITEVK